MSYTFGIHLESVFNPADVLAAKFRASKCTEDLRNRTEAAAAGQDREKRKATESIKYYLRLLVESGLSLGKKRDFPAFRHLFYFQILFFCSSASCPGNDVGDRNVQKTFISGDDVNDH